MLYYNASWISTTFISYYHYHHHRRLSKSPSTVPRLRMTPSSSMTSPFDDTFVKLKYYMLLLVLVQLMHFNSCVNAALHEPP